MEITGKIKEIFETKEYGTNGFQKRQMVLTLEGQYPQHILIDFVQDKVNLLDSFKVGDDAKVSIDLRGRDWTSPAGETKYFNSINGWKIEALSGDGAGGMQPPLPDEEPIDLNNFEDLDDDLPF